MRRAGRLLPLLALAVALPTVALAKPAAKSGKKKKKSDAKAGETSSTGDAAKGKKAGKSKKSGGLRFGVLGGVDYESLSVKDVSPGLKYSGIGFSALGYVDWELIPKLSLPAGVGIHMSQLKGGGELDAEGSDETHKITADISLMSLLFDFGALYRVIPALQIGGFFSLDYGLSGSYKITDEDAGSFSETVKSSSRTVFGARGLFGITKSLLIGGDVGLVSGALTTQPSDDEVAASEGTTPTDGATSDEPITDTLSGMRLKLSVGYLF
jgi:hypothetical protein